MIRQGFGVLFEIGDRIVCGQRKGIVVDKFCAKTVIQVEFDNDEVLTFSESGCGEASEGYLRIADDNDVKNE